MTKPRLHGGGLATVESEAASPGVVPTREGNEACRDGRQGIGAPRSTAEAGEGTRPTPRREGGVGATEPLEGKMPETSGSDSVSTKLQRIAELAKATPQMVLTTLAHHIDAEWLREAYRRTRKDGAVGVDEQTAAQYAQHLDENLRGLLERFKSGTYHAPPVRRVHIPKGDGRKTRPIGIPIPAADYPNAQQPALGFGRDHALDPPAGGPGCGRGGPEAARWAAIRAGAAFRRQYRLRSDRVDGSLAPALRAGGWGATGPAGPRRTAAGETGGSGLAAARRRKS